MAVAAAATGVDDEAGHAGRLYVRRFTSMRTSIVCSSCGPRSSSSVWYALNTHSCASSYSSAAAQDQTRERPYTRQPGHRCTRAPCMKRDMPSFTSMAATSRLFSPSRCTAPSLAASNRRLAFWSMPACTCGCPTMQQPQPVRMLPSATKCGPATRLPCRTRKVVQHCPVHEDLDQLGVAGRQGADPNVNGAPHVVDRRPQVVLAEQTRGSRGRAQRYLGEDTAPSAIARRRQQAAAPSGCSTWSVARTRTQLEHRSRPQLRQTVRVPCRCATRHARPRVSATCCDTLRQPVDRPAAYLQISTASSAIDW